MLPCVGAGALSSSTQGAPPSASAAPDAIDWRTEEKGILANHAQLTYPDRFVKAGEAYFSPDGRRIVFQAVEVPAEGEEAEEFYGMFVADVVRAADGHVTGLTGVRRVSPKGSANTCGWFHPQDPNVLIFASTIGPPSESEPPGYQRGAGRYRWMFPPEMRLVQVDLRTADGDASKLKPLVEHAGAYMAEGSISPDGRHVVYCSLESGHGDLFVKDLKSGSVARIVGKPGYDGGPFFSPDGRRLCWRSDRNNDNLLQLFVADLVRNDEGAIVGVGPEQQLTNDEHVNWCPFWHPSGRWLVFATSRLGHRNYEVFLVDADPGSLLGSPGPVRYGTGLRRISHASGADVLPAFSPDGRTMLWTSQRGEGGSSQLWAADFVLSPEAITSGQAEPAARSPR